ncbi:DUF655 domain-containing protein [Candidatus Micrarchaeota archaeon]|nr:DUF655 domain-containing protein [Candidatus Micrarchaeota archaeon]
MEEYAYVIEYLPAGRSSDPRKEPLVQLLGERFFTLLEATVKPDAMIVPGKRVYVGKDNREEIDRIKRKITFSELTGGAKDLLPIVLRKIVDSRESEFVSFLNKARPISIRVHTLDLLPGIGKKNMEILLSEREKSPFESFEDVKKRIHGISDPASIFINRILSELEGRERHNLFVSPGVSQNRPYRR